MVPKPSTVQPADVGPKKTPFQRGNRTENRTGRAYGVFARSVDIRGNTDESWRRGLDYLLRNYLLREP
jgi:hypothetical protein